MQVHWFSIVNSLLIVFLLSGMVAVIMLRTLRRDVLYYNRVPTEEVCVGVPRSGDKHRILSHAALCRSELKRKKSLAGS